MPKFQLLSAFVDLAGDRNNSVLRGDDNPMTFPEALILEAIHGGVASVHSRVVIGETEDRDMGAELQRLRLKYGRIVDTVFPLVGGRPVLPEGDDKLPTKEEVAAAEAAAAEAREKVRTGKTTTSKAKTAAKTEEAAPAATVPSLDNLPG